MSAKPMTALNNKKPGEMNDRNTTTQSRQNNPQQVPIPKGGNTIVEKNKRKASEINEINRILGGIFGRPAKAPKSTTATPIATLKVPASKMGDDEYKTAVQGLKNGIKQLEKIPGPSAQLVKRLQEAEAAKAAEVAKSERQLEEARAATVAEVGKCDKRVRSVMAISEARRADLQRKLREGEAAREAEVAELEQRLMRTEYGALVDQQSAIDANKLALESKDVLQKLQEAAREVTAALGEMTEKNFGLAGKKMDELRKLTE